MKKVIALLLVLVFCFAGTGFAMHGGGKGGGQKWGGLEEKFCHKVGMIKMYGEEAGLTEEQIQQAKDLKYTTKKQVIEMDAKIESLALDIKKELYEKPADMSKIDPLIDQKYAIKAAKAKLLAAAYVQAYNIPTKDQWKAIKAIKKESTCKK